MALRNELHLLSVVVIAALLAPPLECVSMYPSGTAYGDAAVPISDDGSSNAIPLSPGFRYFYSLKNNLYVNTNGHITFDAPYTSYSAAVLPVLGNSMIIPFWADISTNIKGRIYYRQSTDATLRSRAATDLQLFGSYSPTWLFIATWQGVTYYGGSATAAENTFQVVLITDGSNSFVMFNYLTLGWNNKAEAGFNYGDMINYYAIPGSLTSCVQNLATGTNVGQPGRWIFQIASANNCIGPIKPPTGLNSGSKTKRKKRGAENEVDEE